MRDRCPAGPALEAAERSRISQCSYLTLLRPHLQGRRGRQLKHEPVSCVSRRAPQRSAGERESRAERGAGVQSVAGRDLRINSRAGLCLAQESFTGWPLTPCCPLFPTGMDLRRHELVLRIFWPLLGPDGGQRPRGRVVAGSVGDTGSGLPAALQLHRLEPLRHRHSPGHAEGARYAAVVVVVARKLE